MTEWRLNCYDGKAYTLPNPVAWRLDYGLGSPCDSFWVKTLWSVGQEETLAAVCHALWDPAGKAGLAACGGGVFGGVGEQLLEGAV